MNHPQPAIDLLNRLLAHDRTAIEGLLRHRVPVIADHPECPIREESNGFSMSGLGLLNAVLQAIGFDPLAIAVNDADGNHILQFTEYRPENAGRLLSHDEMRDLLGSPLTLRGRPVATYAAYDFNTGTVDGYKFTYLLLGFPKDDTRYSNILQWVWPSYVTAHGVIPERFYPYRVHHIDCSKMTLAEQEAYIQKTIGEVCTAYADKIASGELQPYAPLGTVHRDDNRTHPGRCYAPPR